MGYHLRMGSSSCRSIWKKKQSKSRWLILTHGVECQTLLWVCCGSSDQTDQGPTWSVNIPGKVKHNRHMGVRSLEPHTQPDLVVFLLIPTGRDLRIRPICELWWNQIIQDWNMCTCTPPIYTAEAKTDLIINCHFLIWGFKWCLSSPAGKFLSAGLMWFTACMSLLKPRLIWVQTG